MTGLLSVTSPRRCEGEAPSSKWELPFPQRQLFIRRYWSLAFLHTCWHIGVDHPLIRPFPLPSRCLWCFTWIGQVHYKTCHVRSTTFGARSILVAFQLAIRCFLQIICINTGLMPICTCLFNRGFDRILISVQE